MQGKRLALAGAALQAILSGNDKNMPALVMLMVQASFLIMP